MFLTLAPHFVAGLLALAGLSVVGCSRERPVSSLEAGDWTDFRQNAKRATPSRGQSTLFLDDAWARLHKTGIDALAAQRLAKSKVRIALICFTVSGGYSTKEHKFDRQPEVSGTPEATFLGISDTELIVISNHTLNDLDEMLPDLFDPGNNPDVVYTMSVPISPAVQRRVSDWVTILDADTPTSQEGESNDGSAVYVARIFGPRTEGTLVSINTHPSKTWRSRQPQPEASLLGKLSVVVDMFTTAWRKFESSVE